MLSRTLLMSCALVASLGTITAEEVIAFRGSLSAAPIVDAGGKAFAEAHPGVSFKITDSSTPASLKAVSAGDVVLGATARDLKPDEKTQYPDLKLSLLCHDGVVLVVGKSFPLDAISTKQVQDIYIGTAASLKDLGGADTPVVPIGRPEAQATQELVFQVLGLESKVVTSDDGAKTLACKAKGGAEFGGAKVVIASNHKDAVSRVLTNPGAVTFIPLGMANSLIAKGQALKVLALDGKVPSEASVLDGTYPLRRKLYLLTKGEPTGTVADFVTFMTGTEGQAIVKKLEFIPIPSK